MTATGTSIDGLLDTITGVLGGDLVPGGEGGEAGGETGGGGTEGALAMPAGTTQGALVNLANDGTITAATTIGANTYRVLSMSGGTAKLLKMQDIGSGAFSSGTTTSFGGTTGLKYEGSTLDTKMNTFYENLPAAVKAAIVPQTIKQSMYDWSWSDSANASSPWNAWYAEDFSSDTDTIYCDPYNCNRLADITVGERYVYALDVDDVVSYFQAQGLEKTPQNLVEMFWNVRSYQPGKCAWLRSALNNYELAFSAYGYGGCLINDYFENDDEARPAFIINIAS